MRANPKRPHKLLSSEWGQYEPVPVAVIKLIPAIEPTGFTLFCYLLYRTNAKRGHAAWPGYRRMNTDLGWGNDRIKRAIGLLENNGLLSKRKRFGATTIYTLTKPESAPDSQYSGIRRNEESGDSIAPETGAQYSGNGRRFNLNEPDLNRADDVEHQHGSKQAHLIKAGVWEDEAAKHAVDFSEEEIAAAIKACEMKQPTTPGAYICGILDRWLDFPEERAREVERLTRDPYDRAGFWDD